MDGESTVPAGFLRPLRSPVLTVASLRAHGILFLAFAVVLASVFPMRARAESEQAVKAAFLFNFARYVDWREGTFENEDAPIRICVAGTGGFDGVLANTVQGRTVDQRAVEVESIATLDSADRCHLIFFEAGSGFTAETVVAALADRAVFTIADEPGFAAAGGIANFILVGQKVRFEINPAAARRAKLKISSSLLRLAKLVGRDQ